MSKLQSDRSSSKKTHSENDFNLLSLEIDYHIVIETGEQGIDTPVTLKVHGEKGSADIPLKGKDDKTSFPSKSINEFTSSEKDVGKIYYITLALAGKNQDVVWHLKKVQLKKGSEEYK